MRFPVVREWPEGRAARGCRPGQRAAGPQRLRPGMHGLFTDGPMGYRMLRGSRNIRTTGRSGITAPTGTRNA